MLFWPWASSGGHELNFSSDVDLVLLYSDIGETDGKREVSNEQYFRALGQKLIGLLTSKTVDGFVYRVDVRLRPFGDSGPLVVSVPALETYLSRHGRDWERYAYVKARVVNDWPETVTLEQDILRPFVYRRYLDYGVFEALREMKGMIEAEVARREFQDNLETGARRDSRDRVHRSVSAAGARWHHRRAARAAPADRADAAGPPWAAAGGSCRAAGRRLSAAAPGGEPAAGHRRPSDP